MLGSLQMTWITRDQGRPDPGPSTRERGDLCREQSEQSVAIQRTRRNQAPDQTRGKYLISKRYSDDTSL